ncbi:zinc finger protein 37-like isoform X2 [Pectinophora gossypiella]|uniref:zinc finger protein 37-like isoform X2 n=1 Tax=Pectinophora gossypiella TaxID=13191 RepID=UPI00214F0450|nr:zinc finger protein 37-like isoform X2 [Pectinophora gossypiella]
MALCESQLDSALPPLQREDSSPRTSQESPEKKPKMQPNGDIYGLDQVPGGLPLSVDYRSPVSHFVPPAVELYAARQKTEPISTPESSGTPTPIKRKRGRPRIDKTSPEYLANLAARKQAKEMAAMISSGVDGTPPGEKRKRGRPRVDKTSPEYLARKRARELEALERKAKREYRRRTTGAKTGNITQQKLPRKVQGRVVNKIPVSTPRNVPVAVNTRKIPVTTGNNRKPVTTGNNRKLSVTTGNGRKVPQTANGRKPVGIRKIPVKGAKVKVGERKVLVRRTPKFVKKRGLPSSSGGRESQRTEQSRCSTADSAASSSAGESTPRVKRKYTKRAPSAKKNDSPGTEKVKGKRGRPRKTDQLANKQLQQPKIRVRSNLMPTNNETITLDSDDEPDLGSPSQASDSLSLDENLRALRHIHEKYANIDKDELYEAHLLAANFKKPTPDQQRLRDDDEVLSIRSSEGNASVKELDTRVEKLEDSSNSDSDSSSSGSGSSSSGSSSSSSSSGSSSSESSDSDSDSEAPPNKPPETAQNNDAHEDDRSFGAWSYSGQQSDSDSDPERAGEPDGVRAEHDEISESDNESADKSFQCHICRKWYSTRVTLKIHRRSHQNRGGGTSRSRTRSSDRYECDCCNETFNRREKLWDHKASAHRGAMTVRCEVCRKCFEDDSELSAHLAMHTADERAGRCADCGALFPRWEQLRRHRAVAHGAAAPAQGGRLAHACHQCGKRFGHAHSLTRHMHNHAKQLYRCVVCKASFARADQLAQHLNSHLANYKRLKP